MIEFHFLNLGSNDFTMTSVSTTRFSSITTSIKPSYAMACNIIYYTVRGRWVVWFSINNLLYLGESITNRVVKQQFQYQSWKIPSSIASHDAMAAIAAVSTAYYIPFILVIFRDCNFEPVGYAGTNSMQTARLTTEIRGRKSHMHAYLIYVLLVCS